MVIESRRGELSVLLGVTFHAKDAERLRDAIGALGPSSRLTVDFSNVHDSQDVALAMLVDSVVDMPPGKVALRGLTLHQKRLLKYLGIPEKRVEA